METSTSDQVKNSINADGKLKELLRIANQELEITLENCKKEEAHNRKLINSLQVPRHVLQRAEKYANFGTNSFRSEIPPTSSDDSMCISLLKKYFNSLNDIDNYLNVYHRTLKSEIQKYEMFQTRHSLQNMEGDTLFEATSQSHSIEPQGNCLADDETEKISTIEQNEIIMARLVECFEIHKRIEKDSIEKEKIKSELGDVRHLPSNIVQAQKKLDDLKVKYKQVSDKVSDLGSNL